MVLFRAVAVAVVVMARLGVALADAPPPGYVDASWKRAFPLGVHGGNAVEQTADWTGEIDDAFTLDVQNISGSPVSVVPTVLGVVQLDKADAPTVRSTIDAPLATGSTVTLGDARPTPIRVPLRFEAPGIYEVETELRDPNSSAPPMSVKTIVYRRRSWCVAALWIGIGALLTFAARYYLDGGQDRLKLRREIALLLQQIGVARDHAKGDSLVASARALQIDVEDRQRYVRWGGTVGDIRKDVQRAELRLALLCDIMEAASQCDRLDPSRQTAVRKVLDDALVLVRLDPCDDARITTKRTEVAQLGLTATWREQLAADLASLESQIAVRLAGARPEFAGKLREINGELTKVHGMLAADQLEAARAALDDSRTKLLESSTGELGDIVASQPPPGVDAGAWTQATSAIKPSLADAHDASKPWADRWSAFKTAEGRYVSAAIDGLIAMANKAADDKKDDKKLSSRMLDIASELAAAVREPAAAAAIYDSRRREIEAASKPRVGLAASAMLSPPIWQPITFGAAEPRPDPAAARQVARLDREVRSSSVAVNIAFLVVGVATGVKTLWLDDPAWGAHGAALTAFLWGASVQVAGNVFAGIATLRSKLGALTS